jgi:hypothetical protein
MFSYIRLKFQVNWSSGRYRNTGQQRLYEFFYLARILFLKRYGSCFMECASL